MIDTIAILCYTYVSKGRTRSVVFCFQSSLAERECPMFAEFFYRIVAFFFGKTNYEATYRPTFQPLEPRVLLSAAAPAVAGPPADQVPMQQEHVVHVVGSEGGDDINVEIYQTSSGNIASVETGGVKTWTRNLSRLEVDGQGGDDNITVVDHTVVANGAKIDIRVAGGNGNDHITFQDGFRGVPDDGADVILEGNDGEDRIDVQSGRDIKVYAGHGNDVVSAVGVETYGNAEVFTAEFLIRGGLGDDMLIVEDASARMYGEGGNDLLEVSGATDHTILDGGFGNDVVMSRDALGYVSLNGGEGAGDDRIYNIGRSENTATSLNGGDGDNYLRSDTPKNSWSYYRGGSGNNQFVGSSGHDVFYHSGGRTEAFGLGGPDYGYVLGAFGESPFGSFSFNGGDGNDTFYYTDISDISLSVFNVEVIHSLDSFGGKG